MNIISLFRKIKNAIIPSKVIRTTLVTSKPGNLLKNEVIIVTGGASGIGKAIAKKAVAQKAHVIIIGRREDKLMETCKEIGSEFCKYILCDITALIDYVGFFEQAQILFNTKITALVNNAGVYINKGAMDFTSEDFDLTINTNLKAPMFMTQNYIKYCLANQISGNIIVTASNRGMFGDYGPYGVSKRGIISYVEGMAREYLKSGIRINAVAPGMTASEINNIDTNGNMYTSSAKGERVLLPDEIAEVTCFLLSKNSMCITGAVIPCDDGDRLR